MAIGPQQDISLHSGDSRTLRVTINDDAGSPQNLTDATFIWALSKKTSDSVAPKGTAILNKDSLSTAAVNTWLPNTPYAEMATVVSDGSDWVMAGLGDGVSGTVAPNDGANLGGAPFFDGTLIWSYQGEAASSPGDIVITDSPNGIIEISIAPADTDALAGDFYHELQMTQGGNISTVLYGQATIVKDLIQ